MPLGRQVPAMSRDSNNNRGTPATSDADLAATLRVVERIGPALRSGDRDGQNEIVRQLLQLRAPMGEQWQALANMVLRNGEVSLAVRAMDMFVAAQGNSPLARYVKASVLERCGLYRESYELVRSLPRDVPDRASYAYSRAAVALTLGELTDVREQLETCLSAQPQMGSAWLMLAQVCDLAAEPETARRILAASATVAGAPAMHQAAYDNARGQALAALRDYAGAFDAFRSSGQAMKTVVPYDRAADRRSMAMALEGYSAAGIAQAAAQQHEATSRAIFVTGMPRSGTTLVAQSLTRHGDVGHAAELGCLGVVMREAGGFSADKLQAHAQGDGFGKLARLWSHLLAERFPGKARVVDKALNTSRSAGFVASLLPDAPLVWVTRQPLDQAWSCFRNIFRDGSQSWTSDLADIGYHFRLEEELLRRWQDILQEKLLVVPYEKLVDDFGGWIGRIAAHCNLTDDPAMLAPEKHSGAVATASAMQVRKPVNRKGIGVAEPYREFMGEFFAAYEG